MFSVYTTIIVKQKQKQKIRGFTKFSKIKFWKFLKIRSSITKPWGHARFRKQIGPDRYIHFDDIDDRTDIDFYFKHKDVI